MTPVLTETRTPGFCALCKSRCGSTMVTRNGRLIAQEPLPDHPTGAALCIKGRAAPEIVYNEQRELYPLRRTRPKGDPEPGWERISWEEALDITAAALGKLRAEAGAEAVAFGWTTPSGTPISDDIRWVERFTNAFGSPNIAYGTEICNWHKDFAHAYTFGRSIASPDFAKSGCVVLWGHNPSAAWLDHATATGAAKARGARLVVVDPRRAGFALRADQWLRVRPGADAVLALGIAGEMIRNGWFDADFIRDWSNGPLLVRADTNRFLRASDLADPPAGSAPEDLIAWDAPRHRPIAYSIALKAYRSEAIPTLEAGVSLEASSGCDLACRSGFSLYRELCETYPPERVEALAWVSAAQVTATAKILFEAGPVSYYAWSGVGQHTNATQTDRAISTLMALTGSFDAPGGNVEFSKPAALDVTGGEFLSAEQRAKCIGLKRSSLGPGRHGWIGSDALYDAILKRDPYKIRGLFGFGRNFLVNHANGARGAEALAKLDFYVHADLVMTPTATFADIFLPINTPWEREALRVGFEGSQAAENTIQLRQQAVETAGESRSDAFVVFELAKRLGLGRLFWDGDVNAGLAEILKPLGVTLDDLRASPAGIRLDGEPHYYRYKKNGFQTHTGKIEFFSEVFRDAGQDPLPRFVEPASSPYGDAKDYPLVLTSAKVVQYCHGQHRSVPSLRRRAADPEVNMHPDTAGERGIANGDWVEIRSANGKARMRVKFDNGLDRRVVSAQYGWWQGNNALNKPAYDAFSDGGANINRLVTDAFADPVSGSTGLRSSVCEIAPLPKHGAAGWAGWREFDIVANRLEADDIMSFEFAPVDGGSLPPFRGGQHLTLRVEAAEGASLVRCYSISGEAESGRYRISVKLSRKADGAQGLMSGLLHAGVTLAPRRVAVMAPKGDFHLQSAAAQSATLVLAASGIGVTPLLSMLYELRDSSWEGNAHLLYGCRSGGGHAFRSELEALKQALPGLTVTTFYSAPTRDDRAANAFDREGRVTARSILEVAEPTSPIFLCGPPGMIDEVTAGLEREGVDASHIHMEAFGPSSRSSTLADKGPQTVTLKRSGATFVWTPGKGSLLEQIEATGVQAASGCRTGQCESCACGLGDGAVAYPAGTSDVGAEQCLPCVAVPLSPIVLDL